MQVHNHNHMAPVAVFQGRAVGLRPAAAPRSILAQAERSYVMVKPDGVQRGLVGQIITRFEQKGFQIKGLKMFQTPEELAKEHYKDLSEKPFYGKLVDYICLLYTSPSPRDRQKSRMPSSA